LHRRYRTAGGAPPRWRGQRSDQPSPHLRQRRPWHHGIEHDAGWIAGTATTIKVGIDVAFGVGAFISI
jgi:hypothetical protein